MSNRLSGRHPIDRNYETQGRSRPRLIVERFQISEQGASLIRVRHAVKRHVGSLHEILWVGRVAKGSWLADMYAAHNPQRLRTVWGAKSPLPRA